MTRSSVVLFLFIGCSVPPSPITPVRGTAAVPNDPDDPAIWIPPSDPSKALIFATDKVEVMGGLYVFGLDGALRHRVTPLDRPNNVDIEYGVRLGGQLVDIAVLTERMQHRLRVFSIAADGSAIHNIAPRGIPVLEGEAGEAAEPMGIALYRRPRDGVVFAIVAPKTGGASNYLWQYRLEEQQGVVSGTLVRRFGAFSRVGPTAGEIGEIEAVVADDALGYVYYADERFGIRKWHADPDDPGAGVELAVLGRSGYRGDREGLALYTRENGTGFLVSSDQIPGATRLMIYPRAGPPERPHDQPLLRAVQTGADSTDGLDVTSTALPGFPDGLLVMMNSSPRNFLLYRWSDVVAGMDSTR